MSEFKKTALYAWHKNHGAHMVNFAGWEMPLNYKTGIIEEHLTTRRYGGLFDISHMGRFLITGAGALSFLQYILTNNAAALEPGQAQYTILAKANGGAIDDAYLYRLDEKKYLLVVNAANTEKDLSWLKEHLLHFHHVQLIDQTEEIAMISLQGPVSKAVLKDVLLESHSQLPDPGKNNLRPALIEGKWIIISRTGYTGEPLGFEIFSPATHVLAVWEKILSKGAERGVIPVGLGARDTLRLEAGLPLYGHELGLDHEGKEIPILASAPAKIAVSFSSLKGDYLGRQALEKQFQELRLREEGKIPSNPIVPRRIWPIVLTSEGVARPNFPVYKNGLCVGMITSATMVPYWNFKGQGLSSKISEEKGRRSIALAYIDAHLKEKDEVEILSRGKYLTGRLVKKFISTEAPPYARPIFLEEYISQKLSPPQPLFSSLEILTRQAKENTYWRQRETINLIPSEQTPSPLVKLLSIADPCARYAEHRQYKFLGEEDIYYYQGTGFIQEVEAKLQEEFCRYLSCSKVETRIISGQMANAAVYSALVDYINRFDRKSTPRRLAKVMNHHLGRGGHLSSQPMGALRDYLAVNPENDRPAAINFPVLEENPYQIDLKRTAELLYRHQPELIVLGKSMVLYREPLVELRRLVDTLPQKTWIMYDMAHVLGLVGPYFQNPFQEGADIVTGSTHKTFFGTQRGIIASNFDEASPFFDLWQTISKRTFPGSLSNHHLGTLLGLLLATYEMNAFAPIYQKQVINNARAFAQSLKDAGLQVEGDPRLGYTETHQVILRVGYARGPEIARQLEENNIIVNYQALPDDEGFTVSSGLRLGVQEMTRFGMREKDFGQLAGLMADIILKNHFVKEEVILFRSRFLQMQYCLEAEKAHPLIQELLAVVI